MQIGKHVGDEHWLIGVDLEDGPATSDRTREPSRSGQGGVNSPVPGSA